MKKQGGIWEEGGGYLDWLGVITSRIIKETYRLIGKLSLFNKHFVKIVWHVSSLTNTNFLQNINFLFAGITFNWCKTSNITCELIGRVVTNPESVESAIWPWNFDFKIDMRSANDFGSWVNIPDQENAVGGPWP